MALKNRLSFGREIHLKSEERERILSLPGKSTSPVNISARMQPADQTSTEQRTELSDKRLDTTEHNMTHPQKTQYKKNKVNLLLFKSPCTKCVGSKVTCLSVMHPVQDDFRGSVPACHHITRHLSFSVSRQSKVQDLTKSVRKQAT